MILTRRQLLTLMPGGALSVEKTEIVTFAENGQAPSDHFPVAAWLTLR